jgi:two-component system nitrogen regulation response regulator GlnG
MKEDTPKGRVLIADDDRAIRTVLSQALGRVGYDVRSTGLAGTLWEWASSGDGDVVITDVMMPDQNTFDLIPRIQRIRPDLPIIVISAQNTLTTAITAAERGAFEYLPKPFDLNEVVGVVNRAMAMPKGSHSGEDKRAVDDTLPLIGRSPAMQEIYRSVARLTQNDLSVLISGESGTGKELVARALHDYGLRKNGQFIAINMAAIPRELVESELFGHEKGAFTGAVQRQMGRFAQAEGGTLFLDEIGDMPMEAQTRLLRVLQEGEFTPVGGRLSIKTNVRIIAATHQDLRRLIEMGQFREDLFFRLNVVPMRLPPLRERREDIPDLVRHFTANGREQGLGDKSYTTEALDLLKTHNWPGNVRELENLVRRIAALHTEELIGVDVIRQELIDLKQADPIENFSEQTMAESVARHLKRYFDRHENELPPNGLYHRVLPQFEIPLIELVLEATRGNQIRAAELLGLNRNTLRKKIKEHGILVQRNVARDKNGY